MTIPMPPQEPQRSPWTQQPRPPQMYAPPPTWPTQPEVPAQPPKRHTVSWVLLGLVIIVGSAVGAAFAFSGDGRSSSSEPERLVEEPVVDGRILIDYEIIVGEECWSIEGTEFSGYGDVPGSQVIFRDATGMTLGFGQLPRYGEDDALGCSYATTFYVDGEPDTSTFEIGNERRGFVLYDTTEIEGYDTFYVGQELL